MTDMRTDGDVEAELAGLDCVVWELLVRDPDEQTAPGIGERTETAVRSLAASFGGALLVCWDDDSVDDVPYYSWWMRLPQAEHGHRDRDGLPVAVAAVATYLRTQLPPQVTDWNIHPHLDQSRRDEVERGLRECYADLLDPLEAALLDLRRDGAQDLDPGVRFWQGQDQTFAGTYALWLCRDPDSSGGSWLVIDAGIRTTEQVWAGLFGEGLRRFVEPGTPLVLLPKPTPCHWLVTATTGTFDSWTANDRFIPSSRPSAAQRRTVSASYRWAGLDAPTLARRVAADLTALIPRLRSHS